MARPAARQMSFADLELLRQGVRLEPLQQAICDFLDKQPALVDRVRRDLVRGLKRPDRSPRPHRGAGVARTGSHAGEELGLSRAARTHRRWKRYERSPISTARPMHDAFNPQLHPADVGDAQGPGCVKTKSDLVVTPSGG